ncbi:MAG: FHA domain-containing protein [Clostridiales bacterium]|jgi:ubiquitin-protein ligase|nr:FHA domain-containing protein [Clostridiales bacterium]
MTARLRRIASDWEQVKKDFAGHRYIVVTPVGAEPPEKYNVTYFVNGIYLLPDGRIQTLGRHEAEILLHLEYPRLKPVCKIKTPIWHPNFKDGLICIGDIWGAGESLSDIIINIGDMIQYKSWNSYSPLSFEAAKWALENKRMFPVGTVELHAGEHHPKDEETNVIEEETNVIKEEAYGIKEETKDIFEETKDIFEENKLPDDSEPKIPDTVQASFPAPPAIEKTDDNDFEITAEELQDIEFIPSAARMQTMSHGGLVKGNRINYKTILVKGILWAFIGALLGFALSESLHAPIGTVSMLRLMGQDELADAQQYWQDFYYDPDGIVNEAKYKKFLSEFEILKNKVHLTDDEIEKATISAAKISAAIFSMIIALSLGLFLGIGEGAYYGSKEKAVKYALIGAGISVAIGFASGYAAEAIYNALHSNEASTFTNAMARGLGWSIIGLGVGISIGLIKPESRRLLFCSLGGLAGGFLGGFIFDFAVTVSDTGTFSRAIGIVVIGLFIGLGIGLLEQFAKQAWLKVVRGAFEGKEYLVFEGTTSIGNDGRNTIVLFKDKLVAQHHCDIVLEGSKYFVVDQGSQSGTVVNGMKTSRHALRQGDAIAIGNSVLVFNAR